LGIDAFRRDKDFGRLGDDEEKDEEDESDGEYRTVGPGVPVAPKSTSKNGF
jgi:hypothetical protein